MDFEYKGPLGAQSSDLHAWFDVPRKSDHLRILFGHWSTLGYKQIGNTWCLDSGCLWGGKLTALRLDADGVPTVAVPCAGALRPKLGT